MDIAEGTIPGQVLQYGKRMLQDGQLLLVPPDLHLAEYPAWHLASSAAHQLFGLTIDGVLYGHSIKNFPC
eukprot:2856232-Lingulodinium_polyedra.AAC.1